MEQDRFAVRSISSRMAAPYAFSPRRTAALITRYSNSPSTRQQLLNLSFEFYPVDDTNMGIGNTSLAINQQSRRQAFDSTELLRQRIIADYDRIGELHLLCEEGPHGFPAVVIHRDAKHGKVVLPVLFRKLHVPGNLLFAAGAPCCPEIEQHDFAPVLREAYLVPGRIDARKVRRSLAIGIGEHEQRNEAGEDQRLSHMVYIVILICSRVNRSWRCDLWGARQRYLPCPRHDSYVFGFP